MYSCLARTHRLGCHLEEKGSRIAASYCVSVSYTGVDGLVRKKDGFASREPENEWYWLVDCKSKSLKRTFEVRKIAVGEKIDRSV